MRKPITQLDSATDAAGTSAQLFDNWFDPIEFGVRSRVRDFIETMMEEELDAVLSRARYERIAPGASKEAGTAAMVTGHRHGHRSRTLLGTFGPVEVAMPRARRGVHRFGFDRRVVSFVGAGRGCSQGERGVLWTLR